MPITDIKFITNLVCFSIVGESEADDLLNA